MNSFISLTKELRSFLILSVTQSFSKLGSSMTAFALIIWSYQQNGSALQTALLSVCSYAPYILMSIWAGAISDRWNKKTIMLVCDSFAAICTIVVLIMLQTNQLQIWHLYCLNGLSGLMNSVQQPAANVAISQLTPKIHYQKASGIRSLSNSLENILTPVIATTLLTLTNIQMVIILDLFSFAVAFISLWKFIVIPNIQNINDQKESLIKAAKSGLHYLKKNRGILDLILFLAVINFIASIYYAALPAMLLSREGGGDAALGIVNTVSGLAMLLGSLIVSILPSPKNRVRVIFNTLLFTMGTENFILSFGRTVPVWCIGAIFGWIAIPMMSTNMEVILRNYIPLEMQGRVYSARNTLQFFTIPVGYFMGGFLVDKIFEPFMASLSSGSFLLMLFGQGKGSGAAFLFLFLGCFGLISCLIFRRNTNIWKLEQEQ